MNRKIAILIFVVLLLFIGSALYWWSEIKKEDLRSNGNSQPIEVINATDVLQGVIDENTKIPPPITEDQLIFDPESGTKIVKDEILIVFREGVTEESINIKIEFINGVIIGYHKQINQYDVRIKNNPSLVELKNIINQLKKDPDIKIATVVISSSALEQFTIPNDPKTGSWNELNPSGKNWGLETIYAPSAWDYNDSLVKVKIGVIEKGFYINHEDLGISATNKADGDFPRFASYADSDVEQNRNLNHGNHVAGIIGALSNNGIGVAGVVWNSELFGFNISEPIRGGSVSDGIEYLVARGIKIINISLGWDSTKMEENIIKDYQELFNSNLKKLAENHEFLIIQGAGNNAVDAQREVLFNYAIDGPLGRIKERVITVGAIENGSGGYQLAQFETRQGSNYGDLVDVVAPGKEIYSTLWNEDAGVSWWKFWKKEAPFTTCFDGFNNLYGCKSGTSMAAPFVTGVTGLIWGADSNLTAAQVKEIIINSADRPITYKDREYKILNAKKSVEFALNESKKLAEQEQQQEKIQPSDLLGQISNATSSSNTAQQTNEQTPQQETQSSPVLNNSIAEKLILQKLKTDSLSWPTIPVHYDSSSGGYYDIWYKLANSAEKLQSQGLVTVSGENRIEFTAKAEPYLIKDQMNKVSNVVEALPEKVSVTTISTQGVKLGWMCTGICYYVDYSAAYQSTPFGATFGESGKNYDDTALIVPSGNCWEVSASIVHMGETKIICL